MTFMEFHKWFMEFHKSFMDFHKWFMEFHKCSHLWNSINHLWNSINHLWNSINHLWNSINAYFRALRLAIEIKQMSILYWIEWYSKKYIFLFSLAYGTHMSIFFCILKGNWDALQSWPFNHTVTFTLMDLGPKQRHHTASLTPNPRRENMPFLGRPKMVRTFFMGKGIDIQCRHLIPALNASAACTAACPIATQFSGHGWAHNCTLICKTLGHWCVWVILFDKWTRGVFITRHWQTSGRLVQELNVCTAKYILELNMSNTYSACVIYVLWELCTICWKRYYIKLILYNTYFIFCVPANHYHLTYWLCSLHTFMWWMKWNCAILFCYQHSGYHNEIRS